MRPVLKNAAGWLATAAPSPDSPDYRCCAVTADRQPWNLQTYRCYFYHYLCNNSTVMHNTFRVFPRFSAVPWVLFCVALEAQAPNFTTSTQVANSSATATVLNQLACWGSGSTIQGRVAVNCPASPLPGGTLIGVVAGGAGGTGSASIIQSGIALCQFDGTSFAAGDYVVPSSSASTAGECHDQGVANTAGTQAIRGDPYRQEKSGLSTPVRRGSRHRGRHPLGTGVQV
jgi:hypothetical protein